MNTRAARFFPFLETLRGYSRADFRADLLAAVTVTPMAVPQAMAYAIIAGVHPQYGIYACMLPVALAVCGIICSIIGSFLVKTKEDATQKSLLTSLRTGTYTAAILSAAMLLEHLGFDDAAKKIHTAVEADIEELGSTVRSTDQVGKDILARM